MSEKTEKKSKNDGQPKPKGKPSDIAYKAEQRWVTNKARRIATEARRVAARAARKAARKAGAP